MARAVSRVVHHACLCTPPESSIQQPLSQVQACYCSWQGGSSMSAGYDDKCCHALFRWVPPPTH